VSLFGGSVVGSLVGIPMLLRQRRNAPDEPEPAEPAETTAEEGAEEEPDAPSLMRTELPFGPFLCFAAVFYLLGETWIQLHFNLFGG
jgi:prepilin signal peptidase PulO-like enzyme (type II secretory pathway)